MTGEYIDYLGRKVLKEGFRAFIYGFGIRKIANSWDEFEKHMATGLWFATEDEAVKPKDKPVIDKPRKKGRD